MSLRLGGGTDLPALSLRDEPRMERGKLQLFIRTDISTLRERLSLNARRGWRLGPNSKGEEGLRSASTDFLEWVGSIDGFA